MATVKIRVRVRELSNVMLQFDVIKVYRCATKDGTYVELTAPGTRVPLVVDQIVYEYIDTTAPSTSYWYKTSFYSSITSLESSLSEAIQGVDGGLYCTLQDLRDEGVTVEMLSDERALILSRYWQDWFEKMTGNFFVPKEETVYLDGDGSRMLLLPMPIIDCTELYINNDFTNVIPSNYYAVYNRRGPIMDDRANPHIMLGRTGSDIYYGAYSNIFEIGDLNQKIVGTFGYVEADGSVPAGVSRAIKILIIATMQNLPDDQIDQLAIGRRIEEVTDRHRIRYGDLYNSVKMWSPTGITEVDMALRRYRSPMRIGSPRLRLSV